MSQARESLAAEIAHQRRRHVATRYAADLDSDVCGIPCGVRIDRVDGQAPDHSNDASDWDHNGWLDIEFTVLDRKGYPAPWLQSKMTEGDQSRIETEILCGMRGTA